MAIEQLKVREIVHRAVSKIVDIPEFQRDFVWDPEQVKLLVESLYRDYPIGSFLLWDSSAYQESKTAQGSQASLWIVDGQQRTTALCLLLGQKPYWWPDARDWNEALERYDILVNLMPEEEDDRLEFALPNPIRRRDPRWISVRRILSLENVEALTPLAQETARQVAKEPDAAMEVFSKIHGRMQRLWQIRERDIPIIKINHEVEDVAEIFARLNREGTRIKEADVVLALAAVRNPGWVREDYLPFRDKLEEQGWDLDAGIFIRTMTGIGRGRARLIEVPRDFWDPGNLGETWKKTQRCVADVLRRLAEFGITSDELLPSTNSLIPLFVLHYKWQESSDYAFKRALHWFLMANRDGRYSGSALTALNEDVRAIMEAPTFENALRRLHERLRVSPTIDDDEFLSRYNRAGNRFLQLMLYLLLFDRGARDWVDKTRIGYDKAGSSIATGFQPQWHHIYPRSVLRKAGKDDDHIHALANITVLNERTNVNKLAGKEPWRYILDHRISREVLEAHLIPDKFLEALGTDDRLLLKERWDVRHYDDFLLERALRLAREANAFLERLKEGE
ncbi:hypothetical protein HRbin22_00118 [Candidatus Thermoflexus japonica]|uniref:GmrSD restriction endonucleases N-terminal domain-containing protein n=1 Tax=Candidatus Thermoflexus japonica TaxID=2035417 RepID=A0A2H5Y3A7_9CHLR|nr:hypothetical protein HRbin22_00118 [Candidatus Thermoflexus japonica]